MSNRQPSGGDKRVKPRVDPALIRFLTRQIALIGEATEIDEHLSDGMLEGSTRHTELVARADQLREDARQDLRDQLGRYTMAAAAPRFTAVGLLAAAFAQSNAGSLFEDETLAWAVSAVLERFVADCTTAAIRDRVEDLLNVLHRRNALVEPPAPRGPGTADDGGTRVCNEPDASASDQPPDIFGFSHL